MQIEMKIIIKVTHYCKYFENKSVHVKFCFQNNYSGQTFIYTSSKVVYILEQERLKNLFLL